MRLLLSVLLLFTLGVAASAEERPAFATLADSACTDNGQPSGVPPDSTAKRNFFQKVYDYFSDSRERSAGKRVDFGVLPGPHFSSTAGFGVGVVATATYRPRKAAPNLAPSSASVYGDMTTKGFFLVGLRGYHIFPKERYRVEYKVNASTFSTQYWGMGYENGNADSNETDYRRNRLQVLGRFLFRLGKGLYVGPVAEYKFYQAREVQPEGLHLFGGQDLSVHAQTVGLSLTYDSRDFMLNASRGWFMQLDQTTTPRFLGNDYCFSSTEFVVSHYRKLWKGAILAGEFHSNFIYGNPAWPMLSELGTKYRMRGYYEGRYRDKNILEAQLELRQHIHGRSGAVAWVGAGQVFPEAKALRWRHTLPNAGIGYRWEFKHRINVRLDLGFTKNGTGVLFNINEAF